MTAFSHPISRVLTLQIPSKPIHTSRAFPFSDEIGPTTRCLTKRKLFLQSRSEHHPLAKRRFLHMIPTARLFDQSVLQPMLDVDPVVLDYRSFFADLDWSLVEHWQAARSSRGRPADPESAYLK